MFFTQARKKPSPKLQLKSNNVITSYYGFKKVQLSAGHITQGQNIFVPEAWELLYLFLLS